MPGSFFVLDSLGETMTSFGNTYLRVEGNTDATGSPTAEHDALRAPRAGGEELHREELPEHRSEPLPDHRPRLDEPGRRNQTEAGRQLNRRTDIKVVLTTE